MNTRIAYGLTVLAALLIPVALVIAPAVETAVAAAVLLMALAEAWHRATCNERKAIARAAQSVQLQRAEHPQQAEQLGD